MYLVILGIGLIFMLVLCFLFLIFSLRSKPVSKIDKNKNSRNLMPQAFIPKNLGVKKNLNLEELVQRLEESLNPEYMKNVKERVLKEGRIQESEYDWYLLELKRFFLMSSILKGVPMYNESVDSIWHELLMFTSSYDDFGQKFLNDKLHHQPNVGQPTGNPEFERAWFEYIYSELFELEPNTRLVYGEFYNNPLDKELLKQVEKLSEEDLLHTYFSANTYEARNVALKLIAKMKEQITEAKYQGLSRSSRRNRNQYYYQQSQQKDQNQSTDNYANSFLFYSLLADNENMYQEDMNNHKDSSNDMGTAPTKVSSCSAWSSCNSATTSIDTKSSCKSCSSCSSCSSSSCSSGSGSSCSSCSS